jgi:dolichol-phosphate mannosyltransferase
VHTDATSLPLRLFLSAHWACFIRFCVVGASGVVVDMAVLIGIVSLAPPPINLMAAKVCAAELAIVSNFLWNDRWTFRAQPGARPRCSALRRFLRFNLICFGGLLVSAFVLNRLAVDGSVNLRLANGVAITASTGWNFLLNYLFTWRYRA